MRLKGVHAAQVNLLQNFLDAEYNEHVLAPADIIAAVERAGYGASAAQDQTLTPPNGADADAAILRRRFWGSLVFLVPLLGGHFFHLPPAWQLIFTLPVLWLNRKIFTNGLKKLTHLAPTMDSLIALGAGASVLFSLWVWARGETHVYFESAAMILTLVTLGKWLEARAKAKTTDALTQLVRLLPAQAVVRRGGKEISVPAADVQAGEEVLVRAGERIACDGTVISGTGAADEAALTGESLPQEKEAGAKVWAGTLLLSGFITLRAEKTGAQTFFAALVALVEQAASGKAPVARLADKVSAVFVPAVMLLACVTLGAWLWAGASFAFALTCAVSVLVISCPCALGLATPAAITAGMGAGARCGIFIKSPAVLEEAARVTRAVLDKTGTITTGKMRVVRAVPADEVSETDLIAAAAALEYGSQHPFARAAVAYAQARGITPQPVSGFEQLQGLGVRAVLNGQTLGGGNLKALAAWHIDAPQATPWAQQAAARGENALFFARDGKFLGALFFADFLKDRAREAVALLRRAGLKILLLSGDNPAAAQAVAQQAGIAEVKAGVLPQEKEKVIRTLQAAGEKVAMAGDGINDAPALARADVGIALTGGTDVAAVRADIVLVNPDVRALPAVFMLARAVLKNIRQNLFWAFFYNALGIPLAAGVFYPLFGWQLNPVFAAAAMSLSSLCVVGNALRLRAFRPDFLQKGSVLMQKTLTIEGMMCAHCAAHVEKALAALGAQAKVDLSAKTARVTCAAEISDDALKEAVRKAGYEVTSVR